MYGFTYRKEGTGHYFEHSELHFTMLVHSDGSGIFYHQMLGNVVHIPTVSEINLGGFRSPSKFDNIRHDLVHVLFCWLRNGKLSRNHQKLMNVEYCSLADCHWEEHKVESLELYIKTGIRRDDTLGYYSQADEFVRWFMSVLEQ